MLINKDREPDFRRHLSPIRHIPIELLSTIFLYCLPSQNWPALIRKVHEAPLLLLRICRQWRHVALSTARLWSRIALATSKSDLLLARTWIDRAGASCPLSIYLGPSERNADHEVIAAITPHCAQWEDITFDLPLSFTKGLDVVKHHLPCLKALIFNQAAHGFQFTDAFESAPQLRSLELCSGVSVSMLKIPWSQLTRCKMGARSLDECFQILKLCPRLIDVEFFSSRGFGPDVSRSTLQLPNLQSIHFLFPISLLGDFFDCITLPALIDFTHFDGFWSQREFISLLKRSNCRLQKLHIRTGLLSITDGDLMDILQLTPSLTVLNLSGVSPVMGIATLDRLTYRGSSSGGYVLPNLQTFRLCHYSHFINHAFVDMLESRWGSSGSFEEANSPRNEPVRLERCFLDLLDGVINVDTSVRTRLRGLRAEGLRVWPVGSSYGF